MKFFKKIFNIRPAEEWAWERMKLEFLVNNYNIMPKGVAHIGGWKCREVHTYKKIFGDIPIVFVEANKKLKPFIDENLKKYNKVRCEYVALGNKNSQVFLNLNFSNPDNDDIGQSSSVLEPLLHPPIGTNKIEVEMTTADKLFKQDNIDFLSIDVQGYELEVLKGSKKLLNQINYIITEVNRTEQYKGCALIDEIDEYLSRFGFLRMETEWWGGDADWGDAFYIKNELVN
jgi:FkbM family methyltransferase|tara:strand:- start:16042 stop:16731 length:690 start_codon:yes stop_codon:yes gene_type:complete